MEPFQETRLRLVVGLLLGFSVQIAKSCLCEKPEKLQFMPKDSLPDDDSNVGTITSISCCKDFLLGYNDSGASIQWSFNGEPYSEEWKSSLKPAYCGNETITSSSGKITDSGNYSCTITATNGTSKTVTMILTMQYNPNHRHGPIAIGSSPNVTALVGERVTFKCEAYVGTNDTNKDGVQVYWTQEFLNNTSVFVRNNPNVIVTDNISSDRSSWGTMKTELVISSVREINYGFYKCIVKNPYGAITFKMSLTEGIPETQALIQRYRTTLMVVASLIGVLVVLLLGWWRRGRLFYLYCRLGKPSSEEYQYDVFLIHGESASSWMWSILLPALEDSFGYTCFLPQRDMCGGAMVSESILEALTKCRRVVVVMTPCLLDSPWASWATYSGIQTVLTSKARILALTHQEQDRKSEPPDQNPLLSVLKVVRKIKVPEEIAWNVREKEIQQQCPDESTQTTNIQKKELKLIMPQKIVRNSSTNSFSKGQRLSNMISGSTTVSKEDLACDDKKKEFGSSVFTSDHQGQDDPSSPSSVTPFILIPHGKSYRPSSNGSVCHSVGWFFRMVCMGNPEEQFWQILRLHIGPPSIKQLHGNDKRRDQHQ